uniref:G-protein coupled receptors family 3 profile domain-containing protein n=1 Tax=Eptatretus burgeri TaxID=7764 RepID=A0A8C4RCB8_EPTBU
YNQLYTIKWKTNYCTIVPRRKPDFLKKTCRLKKNEKIYIGGNLILKKTLFIYAVDEINRNSFILPNTSLGYMIYDSCFNMHKTLTAALSYLGQNYFASCQCLSDKQQFPSFLRTMPSDTFQSIAIARMVRHFGWVYIVSNEMMNIETIRVVLMSYMSLLFNYCLSSVSIKQMKHQISNEKEINKKFTLNKTISVLMNLGSTASDMLPRKTKLLYRKEQVSVNIFLLEFWEQTFYCTWIQNDESSQLCTGSENLEAADTELTDVSHLGVSYNTYMAVYAIAKALHNLQFCMHVKGILLNISCGDILSFEPWQVRIKYYEIYYFVELFADSPNCYSCAEMFWSTKERTGCAKMPVEFLEFSDPLSVILLACAAVGLVFTMLIWVMIYRLHEMQMGIGLLLFALTGCFVCTINFVGEPTDATCPIRNIFPGPLPDIGFWIMLRRVNPQIFVLLGVSPQMLLCISWVLWNPSKSMQDVSANPGTIILECRDSSPVWPISAFSYLGILIFICLCFSVKTSQLSTSFSEIRFITFSMLVCSLICLAFVPAYASTQGKYSTASEIFALLSAAFGIMSCIFVPKYYYVFNLKKSNTH